MFEAGVLDVEELDGAELLAQLRLDLLLNGAFEVVHEAELPRKNGLRLRDKLHLSNDFLFVADSKSG